MGMGTRIVIGLRLPPSSVGEMLYSPLEIPNDKHCKPTPVLSTDKRRAVQIRPNIVTKRGGIPPLSLLAILEAGVTIRLKPRASFGPESSGRLFFNQFI